MVQLENLDISENQLTALPDSICKLSKLKLLTAFKNQLKGLPKDIGNMQSLVEINIFNNKVMLFRGKVFGLGLCERGRSNLNLDPGLNFETLDQSRDSSRDSSHDRPCTHES
jgi:hypothetical protein